MRVASKKSRRFERAAAGLRSRTTEIGRRHGEPMRQTVPDRQQKVATIDAQISGRKFRSTAFAGGLTNMLVFNDGPKNATRLGQPTQKDAAAERAGGPIRIRRSGLMGGGGKSAQKKPKIDEVADERGGTGIGFGWALGVQHHG